MFRILKITFFLSVFSVLTVRAQITSDKAKAIFAVIPQNQQEQLVQRLNLFINLERTKKLNESYEMISKTFKGDIKGGYSLKEYKEGVGKIKQFLPESVQPVNNETVYAAKPIAKQKGHYLIRGCGKMLGDSDYREAMIEAYWENNNWYFSFMQIMGLDDVKECKPSR